MAEPQAPIDFAALAAALLDRAESVLRQWLPDGKREGHEWKARNPLRADQHIGSFSVNVVSGAWADFADGDAKGGDLVSLYAYLRGLNNGQAARELMRDMGWGPGEAAAAAPAPTPVTPPTDRDTRWRPIAPVPADAPVPTTFKHFHRGEPQATWEYVFEGQRWGFVLRYTNSEGGKEIMPYTWCEDTSDGRGLRRWQWKQWDEPRPLYVPATLLSGSPAAGLDSMRPVVVVEGEKCALAGHQVLGDEFDFVSWPGGGKAWAKAAWGWIAGRTVYLWADCDAKRQRLSREEREAGVAPDSKPILPAAKQPGVDAMAGIGRHLIEIHGCTVLWCPIPEPGAVPDGWDIADALAQGWDAARVRDFIRSAQPFVALGDNEAAPHAGASTPSRAGAGKHQGGSRALTWRDELRLTSSGAVKPVRENLVLALDGLQEEGLAGLPEATGVIAYDEFANEVVKLRATPWGTPAGAWDEVDELEMGRWLTLHQGLPSMPRGTLEEAVQMVAKRHRFHPVRDELARLQGRWDGTRRLHQWLARCCLVEDEFDMSSALHQYLARVGTWLMMAICARVLTPGCKFDYMVIFEGPQGWGKSTLARLLGLRWFADTGLVLGDKDSYQNLQSVLVYEWGELDSMNRSEVTKVKQFISSAKDRFRASFDRRARDYPRQVVFIGTTNEDHYLADTTGNRRSWPVRITRPIDTQWFMEHRDQLFAEALQLVAQGERFHPNRREERELFEAQQAARQIENAIEGAVRRYLYDEHQRVSVSGENGTLVYEITTADLLSRLGITLDKQTAVVLRQATAALRHCGWVRFRANRGDRPWMFRRPEEGAGGLVLPGAQTGTSTVRAADDCPF